VSSSLGSTFPQTYRDYLLKYYGSGDGRRPPTNNATKLLSIDDEDVSYFSDGCVDYDKTGRHVEFNIDLMMKDFLLAIHCLLN